MALNAFGLFLLVFVDAETSLFYLVPTLIVVGLGLALFSSPNTNAIMSSVDRRCLGVASGTLGTMRLVGQMLSMGIAMIIFAVFIGNVVITPEYYPAFLTGLRIAFSLSTVLCVLGIFFSLARGPVHEKEKTACKVR